MKLDKVNRGLRILHRRQKLRQKRRNIRHLLKNYPDLLKPISADIERKHRNLWSRVHPDVSLLYLRFWSNFSGNPDHRYVPEDIYSAVIELALNDMNIAGKLCHKATIEKIIGQQNSPKTLIRNISGAFLDGEFNVISVDLARQVFVSLRCDLIAKPAFGIGAGQGIMKLRYKTSGYVDMHSKPFSFARLLDEYGSDFVVQEVLLQHKDLSIFNPSSVNHFRVFTYRSIRTEEVHILKAKLFFGEPESWISNATRGGYYANIDKNTGRLSTFATSKDFKKWTTHPFTGIELCALKVPNYQDVFDLVRSVAKKMPAIRLITFDTTVLENGTPVIIEMNLQKVGINQRLGMPLFGELTEEIVEDVLELKKYEKFRMIDFI